MTRVYILLAFIMLVWGFNLSALAVLVKNIDPITLTSFRIFVAGISVLIITKLMGIFRLPTKAEWKTIGIITIFNVAMHHSFLALGLTKTSGANASIILGGSPLVTMLFAIILLKDRISRTRISGFLLGFIGIMLTSLAGGEGVSSFSLVDIFIFLCMVTQAFSFILISKLNPTFDPRLLTGYMLVIGSLFIFVVSLIVEGDVTQLTKLIDWKLGSIFIFSAVMATAFGHMVYNYAVKHVGPAETAIFANLNTFFALFGTVIFLNEKLYQGHFIGLLFIVIGVFVGSGTIEYMIKWRQKRGVRQ